MTGSAASVERRLATRRNRISGIITAEATAATPSPPAVNSATRLRKSERACASGKCECLRLRRLELKQHDRGRAQQGAGHVLASHVRIRAGNDRDRIFAARVDVDDGDAGRRVGDGTHDDVHAVIAQELERGSGERIVSDGAEKGNLRARTPRRQRLVRALAAGAGGEREARERLARARKALDARDEVDVDRAEDDDHRTGISGIRMLAAPVRGARAVADSTTNLRCLR